MYIVYVLESLKDGKHYTGYTVNIEKRFKEHNSGKTESTKRQRPFKLVHTESYHSKEEAEDREQFLKSGRGRQELKSIISGAVPKW
jgi:putative endonuclease